jgi:hypothetical protein
MFFFKSIGGFIMFTLSSGRSAYHWVEHSVFGKWQWNRRPLIMNQRQDTKRYYSSYLGKALQTALM